MRRIPGVVLRVFPFVLLFVWLSAFSAVASGQTTKPKLTIDEFFNSVDFKDVKLSPDGDAVVIATERADWEQQIFRRELWLYRIAGSAGTLVPLTESGRDGDPQWSPDGQWIAFVREAKSGGKGNAASGAGDNDTDSGTDSDEEPAQLYLISPSGGEAFAVTSGSQKVHAFAWSPDSKMLYFATREPWSKQQTDEHSKAWKDVIQYRGDERGDVMYRISLEEVLARRAAAGTRETPEAEKDSNSTPGAVAIARSRLRVQQMVVARDGKRLAFLTSPVSERQEKMEDVEIYLVDLAAVNRAAMAGTASAA